MRDAHLHDPLALQGAEGPEGLHGRVARNRGKNTTLVASMTLAGAMGPSMVVEGGTDRNVFEGYVERFLAPSLSACQDSCSWTISGCHRS